MNEIIVPHGVRVKLMEVFRASYPTVRKALRGKSESLLSLRIRMGALENGGVEVDVNAQNERIVRL